MNAIIYADGVALAGRDASGIAADREIETVLGAGRGGSSGRFVGRFVGGIRAF
jgi:hypothetical protein